MARNLVHEHDTMHIAHVPKDVGTQKLSLKFKPYLQTVNSACYGWLKMKAKGGGNDQKSSFESDNSLQQGI